MGDFNKVLDAGDVDSGVINVVNEIGLGSKLKVEWNRHLGLFQLDRVEPGIFAKPCNYGFIPQTLDEDGDELDVLIVCDEALQTGIYLEARIVGVMNFDDSNEMDHKVVVVPVDDRHTGDAIKTLDDLGQRWMDQVEHHFAHYKDLDKPGSTKVLGWGDVEDAKAIINESIERWKKEA